LGGSSIFFTVIGAGPFLVPLLFEEVFRWGAVKSGTLVLFIFLGNVGIKPATTFLYSRFGFRTMLISATVMMAATMMVVGFMTASTPIGLIAIVLLLSGIARSIGGTGYSTIAFSDVPAEEMRHANTLQATIQQLALGFGVAGGAIALRLGHPLGRLFSSHAGGRTPYTTAFLLLALLSLLAALGATRLRPGAGDVLRRERSRPAPSASRSPQPDAAATQS
jgi:predicted MFS family arabinose efflux permease